MIKYINSLVNKTCRNLTYGILYTYIKNHNLLKFTSVFEISLLISQKML
jgi:hypothetical protein